MKFKSFDGVAPDLESLRVGVVGPAAPPAGGMAAQTEQLCRLLREEGVSVYYLQTNLPYKPAWVSNLVGLRAVFRLMAYFSRLWKFLDQIDVVHLMSNSGWSWHLFSAPVIWLGYWRGKPVIVNYRGGKADQFLKKSSIWLKPTLGKASSLVVPSGFLEQVFENHGFEAMVIPNIIDTERFRPFLQPQFRPPAKDALAPARITDCRDDSKTWKIIVVRNLEAIYGIDTAIQAIAALKDDGFRLHLSIAGSGPEEFKLKNLIAKLQLQDDVTLLGRLDREQVQSLYHEADIFVNASRVDNMPNSLLESMACGLAIVTTNAGGIPWMVTDEETALMVNVDDHLGMAIAIKRLMEDDGLRGRLQNQGLELIQQYRWDRVKQQWLRLYDEACDNMNVKAIG
ncbi:glycosyltransferase [Pseudomaricurvus hydrocarbonicus]